MVQSLKQTSSEARVVGTTVDDVLVGTELGEEIGAKAGNDKVYARGGGDTVFAGAGNDTVYASTGNDTVYAGSGDDQVFSGLGDDLLFGGEGNDTLYVGDGADTVYAGAGNDLVGAGAGNDAIYGGVGNDTLYAAGGNDSVFGGVGDDVLYGGDGNDTLNGGDGKNSAFGGDGTDVYVLAGSSKDYTVTSTGAVTLVVGPSGTNVLTGIELLQFDDKSVSIGGTEPENTAPVGVNDTYTVAEDGELQIVIGGVLTNDTDADDDKLTSVLVDEPDHGNLIFDADGSFVYIPDANYNGPDTFTYRPNDGTADGNLTTVTINVTPVNDAPVGVADSYTVDEDGVLVVTGSGVLSNDSDVDLNTLTMVLVDGPDNGALTTSSSGGFTYTPDDGYSGGDTFTYRPNDGTVDGNLVTVTLTVNEVDDPLVG